MEAQGSYADIKNFNLSSLELKGDKNPNQKDEYDEAPEGEAPAMQAVPPKEVSAEDKAKQEVSTKLMKLRRLLLFSCFQIRVINKVREFKYSKKYKVVSSKGPP